MDEISERFKKIGIPEKWIIYTDKVVSELILVTLFNEFLKISSQEEVDIMIKRLSNAKSQAHEELMIKELALIIYGDKQEEEIKKLYIEKITDLENIIKNTNTYLTKLKAGDKETITKMTHKRFLL